MTNEPTNFFDWTSEHLSQELTEMVAQTMTGLHFDNRLDQFVIHKMIPSVNQAPINVFCNPVRQLVAIGLADHIKYPHSLGVTHSDDELCWPIRDIIFLSGTEKIAELCRKIDVENFLNYLGAVKVPTTISLSALGTEGECELLKFVVTNTFKNIPQKERKDPPSKPNWQLYLNEALTHTTAEELAVVVNEYLEKTNRFFTVTNPVRAKFGSDVLLTIVVK